MNDNYSVLGAFDGINNIGVDHVAIQTARGMIIGATTLFTKMGYVEDEIRRKEGNWGSSRFMIMGGSIPVQLTDSSDETLVPLGENHVAICVYDPQAAAKELVAWLHWAGMGESVMEKYDDKYFVMIPQLLRQSLEFVPMVPTD